MTQFHLLPFESPDPYARALVGLGFETHIWFIGDPGLPGRNALVLQTEDPHELVAVLERLRAHPEEERVLHATARRTARTFAWSDVVSRILLPRVDLLRSPDRLRGGSVG